MHQYIMADAKENMGFEHALEEDELSDLAVVKSRHETPRTSMVTQASKPTPHANVGLP